MRRRLKAGSAGSTDGTGSGRGARRLALPILGAVCALCLIFGAGSAEAATPELTLDTPVTPDYTSVEVSGEIENPEGHTGEWFLQISADGGNSWQEGSEVGESPRGGVDGTSPQQLTGLIQTGLTPGTTYRVRLGMFDEIVEELAFSEGVEFTTKTPPTPTVTIDPVSAPTASTAHFSGKITPNAPAGAGSGADVAWHFVCDPSCPADEGEHTVPASAGEPEVELEAGELQPSTTYEVRLVGKNAGDPVTAGPVSFQTEALPAPTITLDPITTFADTTATFVGHIDPNKPATGEAAASAVQWSFQCQPGCPGLSGGTVPGTATGSERDVEVHATDLEPNTEYTVTLTGSNRGGPVSTAPETFSTVEVPAGVGVGPGGAIGIGGYRLEGTVNPHNSVISGCFFEWGSDVNYGHSAPCESTPGPDNKVNFVTASLSGLTVGAEYHFRLVATNGTGPVHTADEVFIAHPPCPNEAIREEQGSTYLPECRAYEQVTPVFKEGFAPNPTAFTDDGTLAYLSTGNFAGNGHGYGGGQGGNAYLATRTESGWSTTALAPSGPEFALGSTPGGSVEGPSKPAAYATDLRSTLWSMRRSDQSASLVDLYVRGADGTFTRIGSASDQTSAGGGTPTIVASDDLSHVAYTAGLGSNPAAPGETYEYVGIGGQRRAVSVDNAGQGLVPRCEGGTTTGTTEGTFYHAMSADGRVIFLTCQDGFGRSDRVYARVDGTTTIEVSGSQCTRAPSDPGGACDAHSPAIFQGANAAGTRAYFTTSQQLVNGDTDNTNDLYECDIPAGTPTPVGLFNPCPDLREVSGASTNANVLGVTRISDDGSRAYFVATGVLASNPGVNGIPAAAADDNLYVWTRDAGHPAGETRFVAKLDPADGGNLWSPDANGHLAQTTDDGHYLVFATYASLIDRGPQADTDTARDIYRYDAETGALVRLSTDVGGAGGNKPGEDAAFLRVPHSPSFANERSFPRGAMSDDGSSVVFSTDESLAPNDTNGTIDAYLWHDGRVSLLSSGKPSDDGTIALTELLGGPPTIVGMISSSGNDVYFTTSSQMIFSDDDTITDIYDARVDGGFESQKTAPCTGESCRPTAPPPPTPPDSATRASGPGNPPAAKRCRKGQVKRHGRCVKKQKKPGRHKKDRSNDKHGKRQRASEHRGVADQGGQK